MNKAYPFWATIVILCVSGCGDQAAPIPPDSFRTTVNSLVESGHILIKHVIIEAPAKRTVQITKGRKGHVTVTVDPAANEELMRAEVTFMASLSKTAASGGMLTWLVQIEGGGTVGGGPLSISVDVADLADVVHLEFDQETYPLAQEIVIGSFQGEPIILSVI